jgi:hypothetical protein
MRSAELSTAVRPTERLLQVLRLVYVGAIPLYAIVLVATSGGWPAPGNAWLPYSPMTLPITLGAAITVISSRSVRRSMLSDGALERMLSTEASSSVPGLTAEEQKLAALAPKLVGPFIVEFAFYEAVALYGLVLGFFSHSLALFLPFGVVAIGLLLSLPVSLDPLLDRAYKLLK